MNVLFLYSSDGKGFGGGPILDLCRRGRSGSLGFSGRGRKGDRGSMPVSGKKHKYRSL